LPSLRGRPALRRRDRRHRADPRLRGDEGHDDERRLVRVHAAAV